MSNPSSSYLKEIGIDVADMTDFNFRNFDGVAYARFNKQGNLL